MLIVIKQKDQITPMLQFGEFQNNLIMSAAVCISNNQELKLTTIAYHHGNFCFRSFHAIYSNKCTFVKYKQTPMYNCQKKQKQLPSVQASVQEHISKISK